MVSVDPYAALGVAPGSPQSSVRAAYRELVRRLHPDVNPGGNVQFKRVVSAYRTLSDPELRRRYDERNGTGLANQLFAPVSTRMREDTGSAPRSPGAVPIRVEFSVACRGGVVAVEVSGKPVEIPVPPGTVTGDLVQVSGARQQGVFRVGAHPLFTLDGDKNLHVAVPVTEHELEVGAKILAPALSPAPVKVSLPAGTKSDATVRCRGRGLVLSGTAATCLAVSFRLVTPDAQARLDVDGGTLSSTGAELQRAALLRQARRMS